MAQLKDLIVSGVTRCLGTLYAANIVGDLTGTASKATADSLNQNISSTYIKGLETGQDGKTITFTFGDGNSDTITVTGTTYSQATSETLGVVKLYSTTGNNTDGPMDQNAITTAINAVYASPTFTGTPLAPTVADSSDNSTKIATTAFVQAAVQRAIEDMIENGFFLASAGTADGNELVTAQNEDLLAFSVAVPSSSNNNSDE